jgi:hypothetical protein
MAKKYLSESEFVEKFNGAPYDIDQMASVILSRVDPTTQLYRVARNVKFALADLEKVLQDLEFEQG